MARPVLSFFPLRTLTRLTFVIVSASFFLGVSRAEAGTIIWHWAGPVTGYEGCPAGSICGPTLDTVVPLGTRVDVVVSFNPGPPPNPGLPCLRSTASATLHVAGQSYTSTGFVWDEGHGFGPGTCVAGYDVIEIVVPAWGSGGPPLPDGWVPFSPSFLPGLWWAGELADGQPDSISSQLPSFWKPGESRPQRFLVDLQAVPADLTPVPEPASLTLLGAGLAAAWAARCRRR